MRSLSPAKLWDHCIELESLIRSHTALDIYELQGEVSDTLLSGKTADISPFVEHEWRYICGFPRQEGIGNLSPELIYVQGCVVSYKVLRFYAVLPYFGGQQVSHHFAARATLKLFNGPLLHGLPRRVRLGMFNVTAELSRLILEIAKRLFLLSVHNEVWWYTILGSHKR